MRIILTVATALLIYANISHACTLGSIDLPPEQMVKFNKHEEELAFITGATLPEEQTTIERDNIPQLEVWQFLHVICGNKALAVLPYSLTSKFNHAEKFAPLIDYLRRNPSEKITWHIYPTIYRATGTPRETLIVYRNDRQEIQRAANYLIAMKRDPRYTYAAPPEVYLEGLVYGYSEHHINSYIARMFSSDGISEEKLGTIPSLARDFLSTVVIRSNVLQADPNFFQSGYKKFLPSYASNTALKE